MNKENKILGIGVLSALAASLCCLTPLLALVAGAGGAVSTFSWLEPFRPYTIGLTVIFLGFAWYQQIKPVPSDSCPCESASKPTFVRSKPFLGIVTAFSLALITLPYYSSAFYKQEKTAVMVNTISTQKVVFTITGMTCAGCAQHVDYEVNKLNGIVKSRASFDNGNATVEFDNSKTTVVDIERAINSTGYTVTAKKRS
jgi:mercuric ion transport protein